jgi:hypothetical protein
MKNDALFQLAALGALACLLTGSGCRTSPARFFVLTPTAAYETSARPSAPYPPAPSCGIGPISIPDYMDRAQIATRTSANEVRLAEFDRWAGSPRENVERVLAENLSALLPSDQVSVVTWRRGGSLQYRIAIEVSRFDVQLGKQVLLNATWTVFGADGTTALLARESSIHEPVNGGDYAAAVAAMSQALGDLSREVAEGFKTVLPEKGGAMHGGRR